MGHQIKDLEVLLCMYGEKKHPLDATLKTTPDE